MKKQFLLLAGSALILASCGSNNNNAGQTQAQMDSSINAKVAAHDAENAAKNDSTLKAVEKEKAEAIARERHEEKKHEEKTSGNNAPAPAPAPAPVAAPPPPPPPAGGMRGHAQQGTTPTTPSGTPASGGMRAHAQQSGGN